MRMRLHVCVRVRVRAHECASAMCKYVRVCVCECVGVCVQKCLGVCYICACFRFRNRLVVYKVQHMICSRLQILLCR